MKHRTRNGKIIPGLMVSAMGAALMMAVPAAGQDSAMKHDMADAEAAKAEMAHGMMLYKMAVKDTDRPDGDRARDAGRKPAEVLEFFGIKPGQRVVDLYSNAGYYTRVLSGVVGPEGSVVAHNRTRIPNDKRPEVAAQFSTLGNVETVFAAPEDLDMPDASVDAVVLALLYHHWHFGTDDGEQLPELTKKRIANVMRMLKPGGTFAIVEHRAADDATRAASAKLHRTPGPVIIADLTSQGFEFAGESDVLDGNKDDDLSVFWRGNVARDQSRRVVQKFIKPAE